MTRQSQTIVLLLCAALVMGCGSDDGIGPDATSLEQPAFSVLVAPKEAVVFAAVPGNALQLTVAAFDEAGKLIGSPYSPAYSSSAPGIASVSNEGVVTGIALGTATITTTVTIGNVTRVATTSVTVALSPFDHWRIAGTYDLTATLTLWDGGESWQYTGVLTIPVGSDAGTFTDLRLLDDGGEPVLAPVNGPVTLDVQSSSGLFAFGLGSDMLVAVVESVEEPDGDAASSPLIKGAFYATQGESWMGQYGNFPGSLWVTGPFVATLRGF